MHLVITGGGGFLGQKLARALLSRSFLSDRNGQRREIEKITLFDLAFQESGPAGDPRLERCPGDIGDKDSVSSVAQGADIVFHLAAVVSADAETNFDRGMQVNLDGFRNVLEACRKSAAKRGTATRVIYASSIAVFGGEETIDDHSPVTPLSSYGSQKAAGELLLNDYSRKGFIDGRGLRLPTIIVRPGMPNKAASSFASSIIREPLRGISVTCPVSPESHIVVLSPRRVVDAFIHASELPGEAFGRWRILLLGGIAPAVSELVEALIRTAGKRFSDLIAWKPDQFIQDIVNTWPQRLEAKRSEALGFQRDDSPDEIVRQFIEDELNGRIPDLAPV